MWERLETVCPLECHWSSIKCRKNLPFLVIIHKSHSSFLFQLECTWASKPMLQLWASLTTNFISWLFSITDDSPHHLPLLTPCSLSCHLTFSLWLLHTSAIYVPCLQVTSSKGFSDMKISFCLEPVHRAHCSLSVRAIHFLFVIRMLTIKYLVKSLCFQATAKDLTHSSKICHRLFSHRFSNKIPVLLWSARHGGSTWSHKTTFYPL